MDVTMGNPPQLIASASDCIKLWNSNVEQVDILGRCKVENISSGYNFIDVAWNRNSTNLAAVSKGNGILLYDFKENGGYNQTEFPKSGEETSVCFGKEKGEIYSGGATGDVNLWNSKTGALVKTFDRCHKYPIRRLIKLEDGKIVSACTEGEIVVWDPKTGLLQMKLKTSKSKAVRALENSKFDQTVLCTTCDDGVVSLWDIEKQTIKHAFKDHVAPAMDLSFSTINRLIFASCGLDKKVIFYDIEGCKSIKSYACAQPVTAICFLSNGVQVCAGTSTGNIFLYDLRGSKEPLTSVQAHSMSVQRLMLQTRDRKRSSKTDSRSFTSNRKSSRTKNHAKLSDTVIKPEQNPVTPDEGSENRHSRSKIPEVELPQSDRHANGDGLITPARTVTNYKGHMEKSLGLQTPLNRSGVSSKRDTLGSYCEGIFSPVASVNGSVLGDVFPPDSVTKSQRKSKGTLRQSGTFNPTTNSLTPSTENPSRISYTRGSYVKEPPTTAVDRVEEVKSSSSITQMHSSTPSNPVTNSPLSPGNETFSTIRRAYLPSETGTIDTLANGNHTAANQPGDDAQTPTAPHHSNPLQYQHDFLKNTVHELIESHEDNMRDEIRHLHIQVIKMFSDLNDRVTQLAEQCSVNPLLLQEIERLRAENDRLRRKY